jgi:hypothetical protein
MPDGESGILGRDSTTTFMEQGSNSFHAPNVIYEPSIQIGRDLQGFVNPAKVIVCVAKIKMSHCRKGAYA